MTLNEYQEHAGKTAVYNAEPDSGLHPRTYCILALAGEAGELANEEKKVWSRDKGKLDYPRLFDMKQELGDVLWYVARAAKEMGFTLEDIADTNIKKLKERHAKKESPSPTSA